MIDIKQPDGTWATSPFYGGFGPPDVPMCADEAHVWHDSPLPPAETYPRVQIQQCSKCRYSRGRYLDDPHPEAQDGGTET
jgi:hypothetical protein